MDPAIRESIRNCKRVDLIYTQHNHKKWSLFAQMYSHLVVKSLAVYCLVSLAHKIHAKASNLNKKKPTTTTTTAAENCIVIFIIIAIKATIDRNNH